MKTTVKKAIPSKMLGMALVERTALTCFSNHVPAVSYTNQTIAAQ
ncbi:hypothetical protein [Latilactobacillus sakei]